MPTQIKIKLWHCTNNPCEYHIDAEPTLELMSSIFPGVPPYKCPACYMGQNPQRQRQVVDLIFGGRANHDDKITIMGEDELDTHEVPDGQDEQGNEKKRNLTLQEKEDFRKKIREDIIKFKALEDL